MCGALPWVLAVAHCGKAPAADAPASKPTDVASSVSGALDNQQSVAPSNDTSVTDAAAGTADAQTDDGNSVQSGPLDVVDAMSIPPANLPQHASPSSGKPCFCYPSGEDCKLFEQQNPPDFPPKEPVIKPDPAMKCPAGEVCRGSGYDVVHSKGKSLSWCRKPCWHPKATIQYPFACPPTQECKAAALVITYTPEPYTYGLIGVCIDKGPPVSDAGPVIMDAK